MGANKRTGELGAEQGGAEAESGSKPEAGEGRRADGLLGSNSAAIAGKALSSLSLDLPLPAGEAKARRVFKMAVTCSVCG